MVCPRGYESLYHPTCSVKSRHRLTVIQTFSFFKRSDYTHFIPQSVKKEFGTVQYWNYYGLFPKYINQLSFPTDTLLFSDALSLSSLMQSALMMGKETAKNWFSWTEKQQSQHVSKDGFKKWFCHALSELEIEWSCADLVLMPLFWLFFFVLLLCFVFLVHSYVFLTRVNLPRQ